MACVSVWVGARVRVHAHMCAHVCVCCVSQPLCVLCPCCSFVCAFVSRQQRRQRVCHSHPAHLANPSANRRPAPAPGLPSRPSRCCSRPASPHPARPPSLFLLWWADAGCEPGRGQKEPERGHTPAEPHAQTRRRPSSPISACSAHSPNLHTHQTLLTRLSASITPPGDLQLPSGLLPSLQPEGSLKCKADLIAPRLSPQPFRVAG